MRRLVAAASVVAAVVATAVVVAVAAEEGEGYAISATVTDGLREPSGVALLPDGGVVVTDAAAGSVVAFGPDGVKRWTVTPGLDRPSGLGLDERGLWVADTGHHRIVLLEPGDGAMVDEIPLNDPLRPTDVADGPGDRLWVACSPEDRVLQVAKGGGILLQIEEVAGEALRAPRSVTADGEGGIFIAEALGGRVLHVDRDGTYVGQVGGWGLGEGEFLKPKDVALLPDGLLAVADSHQGIVQIVARDGTFQRLVASADGPIRFEHAIGVVAAPDGLWVADAGVPGLIRLTPRGRAWLGGRFPRTDTLFREASVRDPDPKAVCRQCHDGTKSAGAGNWDPAAKNHPLESDGESSTDIPASFRTDEDGRLLCVSCHSVHGDGDGEDALDDGVVRVRPSERRTDAFLKRRSELCLECHADTLDLEAKHRRRSHPIGVEAPAGADALVDNGGRLEEGRVGCVTCHKTHGATADPLLVVAAEEGVLCAACHEDVSHHSLHPVDEKPSADERARILGLGGSLDPSGDLTCMSCHDPHGSTAGTLLRTNAAGTGACSTCHEEQHHLVTAGGHAEVSCAECHGMHAAPRGLGDGPRRDGIGPGVCLDCHADGSRAPQVSLSDVHPLGDPLERGDHGDLPAPGGRLGCTSCHSEHGPDARLLLEPPSVGELCVTCHEEMDAVRGTDHDASVVRAGATADTCLSCHEMHGSALPYLAAEKKEGVNPADGRCLSCHDGSTRATKVLRFDHPPGLLLTTGGLPFRYEGEIPYFGPDGERTRDRAIGEITCVTCHDPHRWKHDQASRPGELDGSEQDSFLRDPAEVIRYCTVCHGSDGRPKFRFFHEDTVRKEEQP